MTLKRLLLTMMIVVAALGCSRAPDAPTPAAAPPPEILPATVAEAIKARDAGNVDVFERALQRISGEAEPIERRRANALLGLYLAEHDQPERAIAHLAAAASEWPQISPFLRLRLAGAMHAAGRTPEAIAAATDVADDSRGTTASRAARLLLPALLSRSTPGNVVTSLEIVKGVAIDEMTESDFFDLANALEAAGMKSHASAIRFRMLSEYPAGRFTERVYTALTTDPESPLLQLSFSDSTKLVDRLTRVNRYDQVLDILERVERRFPNEAGEPYFVYLKAQALFNSRNYDRVVELNIPEGRSFHTALQMLRARAYWRTDRNDRFLEMLRDVLKDSPNSREANEARLQLGKYYITDAIDYARATSYFEEAIRRGALGNDGENLWTLGWIQTLSGNDAAALKTFARYVDRYPDADYTSNSLFWSGKVSARTGRTQDQRTFFTRLIATYPYSYYSHRAREILGAEASTVAPAEAKSFPNVELAPGANAQPKIEMIEALVELGMSREAAAEVKQLAAAEPENLAVAFRLADLYARSGEPLRAMGILQRSFREPIRHGATDIPPRFWEILYPLPYWDAVVDAAKKQGIDPYRVTAIIRQESGFNPFVVSSAGAVGLAQIMPAEAERIARGGGITETITREKLFDPRISIHLGAAEFAQKRRSMDGNDYLAIAAYNAGEQAVGRWLARTGVSDIDVFIESIAFNETRLYVKNVTRNYHEYGRIYGPVAKNSEPDNRDAAAYAAGTNKGSEEPPSPR